MRKPSTKFKYTGQPQNTGRNVLDKLQKRPVSFLVALNTLDKFLGRHAQVEDVTTRF